jgi:3-deoxy-D-manno-octulosonate 8-phosphate phosphatase (KDO 8-P phosphatase)
MTSKAIIKKAAKIRLVLLDVDGVLTDGSLIYDQRGKELKSFYVRDGVGIKWLQLSGIEVAILSGRKSIPLEARAKELKIDRVIQSTIIKLPAFEKLIVDMGLKPQEVAYVGDDVYDVAVLKRVGLAACPSDAVAEVKQVVDYISKAKGGRGAIREVSEIILKAQNKWKAILNKFDIE